MRFTTKSLKSKHILHLLKPSLNPKPYSSSPTLKTAKPSLLQPPKSGPPPSFSTAAQIVEILKSNDADTWKSNDHLTLLLSPLSSDQLLHVSRCLGNSQTALQLVEFLRSNPSSADRDSLSFVFQAVFELVLKEPNWENRVFELLNTSKELGIGLTVCAATHLIRSFGRAKLIDKLSVIYDFLEPQKRNTHVRNVLIDELLKNGCLDDAHQVLNEMLERKCEYLPDGDTGDIVFTELLKRERFDRRVSEDEFIGLVKKLGGFSVFPDSIRLTQWITKFCRYGRSDKAWELLHCVLELDGPVDIVSYNALLSGLAKFGKFKRMNELVNEMNGKGIKPNVVTFGIGINHLCKARRIDEALELFQKIKDGNVGVAVEPDVVMYNTLIDGLCKVGRIDDGLELMRKMGLETKHSPTTVTYNCLIDGFCKAGELERSLELFDEMKKEGIEQNLVTVNCLVSGMCRHGKVGTALEFYQEMKKSGFEGNAVTYTTLIGGFCGVNNMKKAMELFNEMNEKCKPDDIVYYTLISGLSQAGLMDDADIVLSEMRNAGFKPDIACYNIMINGFCKKKKLKRVYELLQEMEEAGLKPDSFTYNTLISYFSKAGDLKIALKLLKLMVEGKVFPTVVTYGTLIDACCSVGKTDVAMKIFDEMRSSTRVPPNTVIYNTLISSLCHRKNLKRALSLLDDMKLKHVSPTANTFNPIFKVLQEENMLGDAFKLMDRMIEEGCNPDYITIEVLNQWLPVVGHTHTLRRFLDGYKVSTSAERAVAETIFSSL